VSVCALTCNTLVPVCVEAIDTALVPDEFIEKFPVVARSPLIVNPPLRVVFPLRTGMIPTVFAVTFVPAERIDALIDID
jgi:hypothetical protein